MIYEQKNKTIVYEVGLIPHQKIPYLAASSDGVASLHNGCNDDLINIEFKSLSSRNIDGKVKKSYYHQMQHQMECLNLDKTHFVEAKYSIIDSPHINGGSIIEYFDKTECELKYLYSKLNLNSQDQNLWLNEKEQSLLENHIYIRRIYWKLEDYCQQIIERDPHWYSIMKKGFKLFWDNVCYFRKHTDMIDKVIFSKNKKRYQKKKDKKKTFSICML